MLFRSFFDFSSFGAVEEWLPLPDLVYSDSSTHSSPESDAHHEGTPDMDVSGVIGTGKRDETNGSEASSFKLEDLESDARQNYEIIWNFDRSDHAWST